jgi:hypothetical protein
MKKKKLKRREEKEENNKKKISKSYTKKEKSKKIRAYGRTGTFWPQNIAERISEAAMGAAGTRDLIFHSLCGPVERKKPWIWAAQVRQIYLIFEGRIISSEAAMGGGGRAAPCLVWQWADKDGCAQRTGAHARPKHTIL